MKRRVVVTGLGLITACGNSVIETWDALMEGKSGADFIKKFDTEKFDVKFACEVKGFDVANYLDRKEARKLDPFSQYAIAAADEAVKKSGITTMVNANGFLQFAMRKQTVKNSVIVFVTNP